MITYVGSNVLYIQVKANSFLYTKCYVSEIIYTTNYTYCPIDLTNGEYRLNITTINGAGTGIWNSNTTMFKTGNVQLNNINKKICLFTDPIFNISNMTYCQNKK